MHNRVDDRVAAMAVVVQEQISPEIAGVLFTADPVTGSADRIIIEANYGLASTLVDGQVSPDRIVLSRAGLGLIQRETGRKSIEALAGGDACVNQRKVDAARAGHECIDEALAERLGRMALDVERVLGGPQDMEWAFAAGRIFLLQSRPITNLSYPLPAEDGSVARAGRDFVARDLQPDPSPRQDSTSGQPTWSNMNSWEILPDVVTPMSWSVVQYQLDSLFGRLLKTLGVDMARQPLFGLIAGRAYANLDTFAAIIRSLPGLERWDFTTGLGGQQGPRLAALVRRPIHADWRERIRRILRWPRVAAWAAAHAPDQRSTRTLGEFRRQVDRLADMNLTALAESDLLKHLAALLRVVRRFGPDTAASVAVAMGFLRLFFKFVERHVPGNDDSAANRMLGGLSALASAEAGLDLRRLAVWVGSQPALAAKVAHASDFSDLRRQLLSVSSDRSAIGARRTASRRPGHPSRRESLPAEPVARIAEARRFLARWDQFIRRHGHHAFGEMDIYNPRWSENPDFVLAHLQDCLPARSGEPSRRSPSDRSSQRAALIRDFREQLHGPLQRELFDYLFRKARCAIALRENARNECVRILAAVRMTLLELGRRLSRRGALSECNDVFYVELAELASLLAGTSFRAKIASRKAEVAYWRTISPPPVVGRFDPQTVADDESSPAPRVLHGLAASAGVAIGRARVILRPDQGQRVEAGEILIAPHTDPGWTPCFLSAAGIVMDVGGMLSHGTIIAREYGIPTVVNVCSATRAITTGQIVRVDGNQGIVTVVDG